MHIYNTCRETDNNNTTNKKPKNRQTVKFKIKIPFSGWLLTGNDVELINNSE